MTWTPPADINAVDTTSDTPAVIFDPQNRRICVIFRGRTTSNIFYTCSATALPGSWPASTQIPGITTSTGPTATAFVKNFGFGQPLSDVRNLVAFRANDATGRIFVLRSAGAAVSFTVGAVLVQPFCCTNYSPSIFSLIQPGTGNLLPALYWVSSSTQKIILGYSIDNGATWSSALTTSPADTTKDQNWAAEGLPVAGPAVSCIFFTSNDATNIIRSTCSASAFPGSWPTSTAIN